MSTQPKMIDSPISLSQADINEKIIAIQSCLIRGHSFQAIMKTKANFIHNATNADIIAMCLNHQQHLSMEFLGSLKRKIIKSLKSYGIQPRSLLLDAFLQHHQSELLIHQGKSLMIHSLTKVFDGLLTEKHTQALEKELGFDSAFVYPIFTFEGEHIGYMVYFYLNNHVPNRDNLQPITNLIQKVIQPLYDPKTRIFYSKSNRSTDQLQDLTRTEKRIVRKLLKAQTYKAIAEEMNVSVNTIKSHMKNIFAKLQVNSKIELFNKIRQ